MQQELHVLDLFQVVNPLYVLPIVAVLLCAFLVYAFGFKSPVQPPSFDEIEVDRKTTKKRKVKDSQKGKSQNGKIASAKLPDNLVSSNKKKPEKTAGKIEAINKSNVVEKKKKQNASHETRLPAIDDINDDGWVHLVSKKGRKNRRKDEFVTIAEVLQPLIAPTEVSETPCEVEISNKPQSVPNIMKTAVDRGGGDNISKKHVEVEVQLSAQPAKTVKKHIDLANEAAEFKACDMKTDEQNLKNEFAQLHNIESGSSELESSIATEILKANKIQKQPKKKKKKKNEISAPDIALDGTPVDSPPVSKSQLICPLEPNTGIKLVGVQKENLGDKVDDSRSSNVAFDELEGLYQDTKAKKKKKVRREH